MTVSYLTVIFFVGLDRLLKVLARQGYQLKIIGEIFKFNFVKNFYIAFSLPIYGAWLSAAILLIILLLIFYLVRAWREGELAPGISLLTIILGASSNLYDRFKFGYVIDYLDLKYFTVFNLADAMIVMGMIFLLFITNKKEID